MSFLHIIKNERNDLIEEEIETLQKKLLRTKLRRPYQLVVLSYEKKYINVLGPTGVGKTTTIAKMAARSVS